jgi:hypothetical protein
MIDWKNMEDKIKNCKYKHVIIFNFFNLMQFMDDQNAAIILRLIMKNNIEIFTNYPFYILCKYIPKKNYPITLGLILSFYELIREEANLIVLLSKWYFAYKNKAFWNKEISNQLEDLEFLKKHILAIFDNSFGGVAFGIKMAAILKTNNENSRELTINSAIERLELVYNLMGENFFKILKIPLLIVSDFIDLSDDLKVKYVNTVHLKTAEIISLTIDIFEKYLMINHKIENLLDPFYVNIQENTTMSDDIEDMKIFFN